MPGFIEKADELKSKGVEKILCLSGITSHLIVISVNFNLLELFQVYSLNLIEV